MRRIKVIRMDTRVVRIDSGMVDMFEEMRKTAQIKTGEIVSLAEATRIFAKKMKKRRQLWV